MNILRVWESLRSKRNASAKGAFQHESDSAEGEPFKQVLSPESLHQLRLLKIKARRMATEEAAGQYRSSFHGRGMEFQEVREYEPGDDIRHIDWNVTARMDRPYVKVFREERELSVLLMVDVSASQFVGGQRSKWDVAKELAALLAFLSQLNGDRIGLLLFSNEVERYIKPGRRAFSHILAALSHHTFKGRGSNLARATEFATKLLRKRSVVFILSDFFCNIDSSLMTQFALNFDVTWVALVDDHDFDVTDVGYVKVMDVENGDTLTWSGGSQKSSKDHIRDIKALAGGRIGFFDVSTKDKVVAKLVQHFKNRELFHGRSRH
jgi:Mg-chelatase subunit ChlD